VHPPRQQLGTHDLPFDASISGWKNATISPSSIARRKRLLAFQPADQSPAASSRRTVPRGSVRRPSRDTAPRSRCAALAGGDAVHGRRGDTDADRRRHFATLGVHRLREHADQPVGDGGGATDVEPVRHHHDELVAAHPTGDRTPVSRLRDRRSAMMLMNRSPPRWPSASLTALNRSRSQNSRPTGFVRGRGQHLVEQLERAATVVEPGQRIVRRLMCEPFVGAGQLVVHTGQLAALVRQVAQQPLAAPLQADGSSVLRLTTWCSTTSARPKNAASTPRPRNRPSSSAIRTTTTRRSAAPGTTGRGRGGLQ
jgi:hypothetical protein